MNSFAEIAQQLTAAFESMFFAKILDRGIPLPLRIQHFIAADMEIRVGKERSHFTDETIQKCVDVLARRIQRGLKDPPFPLDLKRSRCAGNFGISGQPTGGVAGNIELGHHPEAALRRVGNYLAYFGLGIELTIGTPLLQFRKDLALYAETLVV